MRHHAKSKRSLGEQIGHRVIVMVLFTLALFAIYPFWHVVMYSLSDSRQAMTGGLFFLPRSLSFHSYRVLAQTSQIWVSYRNTIWVTTVGTLVSMLISILTAFPLSLPRLRGRKLLTLMFFATMLFQGGMIPLFMVVKTLGMLDSFWSMIIPGMMSAYNMFILRNCFQALPPSLEESAYIDGANPFVVLFCIIVPVSAPSLAAVTMFYAVKYWNAYLNCLLYVNNDSLQVLQIYLRNLMTGAGAMNAVSGTATASDASQLTEETIKMTAIAISILPVLIFYPFLQRFYTKGIVVGAVKG